MQHQEKVSNNQLEEVIKQRLRAKNFMSIAEFMTLCLGHPQFGYYMTRDPFGMRGDFTTAPEISQMFGEMIGVWLADTWQKMGSPQVFHLIEVGPGRGTLMADILRVVAKLPDLSSAMQIHLVEMSPILKRTQQATLKSYSNIFWHEHLETIPEGAFICIGNEFLDALPVQQFQKFDQVLYERGVALNDLGQLSFALEKTFLPENQLRLAQKNSEAIVELSPARESFVEQLCHRLQNNIGAVLLIDYGSQKSGVGDTLQAVKQHQFVHPLADLGEADLTTHVDFEQLSLIAQKNNMLVCPVITQREFLSALGISARAEILKQKAGLQIENDLKRLIGKDEMGDLFKVFCFAHQTVKNLSGFVDVQ